MKSTLKILNEFYTKRADVERNEFLIKDSLAGRPGGRRPGDRRPGDRRPGNH